MGHALANKHRFRCPLRDHCVVLSNQIGSLPINRTVRYERREYRGGEDEGGNLETKLSRDDGSQCSKL